MEAEIKYELEFRPAPPPPPPIMIIRRNDDRAPLVMSEDEGFELYMVLRAHFEGDDNEPDVDAGSG